jgi:hypothetical protein
MRRGCEAMIHGIWAILDANPDWVVFQANIPSQLLIALGNGNRIVPTFPFCSSFLWPLSSFVP